MAWTCPQCGKKLKRMGNHPDTHIDKAEDVDFNAVEAQMAFGPAMGGEISRLRILKQHDPDHDWDSVYNAYVKSPTGAGDSRRDRDTLRKRISPDRKLGEW